jgi:antitoxin (DNA-binding transcriptional repressor) of toxin-antitoxin stability system
MHTVDLLNASVSLSRLVDAIEQGEASEIIIVRDGRPAAKLVPVDTLVSAKRIGVAAGIFEVPDSIDNHNHEVARLFLGPSD